MEKIDKNTQSIKFVVVGAGLSGLILAWRCLSSNPNVSVIIIDSNHIIGGDHTWSFNINDIESSLHEWIEPFIAHSWKKYDVKFKGYSRRLNIPYCTGNSNSLRACVDPFIKSGRLKLILDTEVVKLTSFDVTILNGEKFTGDYIFDARGFTFDDNIKLGIQKFYGKTIETAKPHNLKYPIIMDATVSQHDGYRFIYCLPFGKNQILIEDTYYSDGLNFDQDKYNKRIDQYIEGNNWTEHKVIRVEKGILPITLAIDSKLIEKRGLKNKEPIKIGMRGNFYHPVTGYSFPDSVRLASKISRTINSCDKNKLVNLDLEIRKYKLLLYRRDRYFRLLNRLLFKASSPSKRHLVLQRFYTLSESLIKRFYEGNLHKKDMLRILIGKPPVPVLRALYFFSERAFVAREKKRVKND
ncbi:MAG: lycopene beta-cyclase CrtY [Hellea sp.]|nr:lycopene beta-cyclase CrtY [Hellea sp.]MDG1523141.1 lycopene beta-cyclase CrtY [Hellea sp.]MDG2362451.1 lycopene beta-cyclase CrtY [Hellea sp.]